MKPSPGDFVEFWLEPCWHYGMVEKIQGGQGGKVRVEAFCVDLDRQGAIKLQKMNLFGLSMEFEKLRLVNPDVIFVDIEGWTLSIRELYEAVSNR